MSVTEDQSLTRIRRIADQYRGATWALNFESESGGAWSMKITPPADPDGDEMEGSVPGTIVRLFPATQYPVFAMRCDELEVIAEALEHWHARVIMRLPEQPGQAE